MFHQERPCSNPSHAGKKPFLLSTCLLGSMFQVTVPGIGWSLDSPKERIGF